MKAAPNPPSPESTGRDPEGDGWRFDELDSELQAELLAGDEDEAREDWISGEESLERVRRISAGQQP